MIEQTSIKEIKGVGEKTQKLFEKVGIFTVGDLIRYYPRGYDVYEEAIPISEVEEGHMQTVSGAVFGKVQVSGTRNMQVTTAHIKDLTGTIQVIWFRMSFLRNTLKSGQPVILRGKVTRRRNRLVMEHPELFCPPDKYDEKLNTLQPIYGLTAGLSNNTVMKAVKQALEGLDLSKESLPEELRLKYQLAEYNYAVRGIHFPEDKEVFYHARKRLVFEEFLSFILSLRKLKTSNERMSNEYVMEEHPAVAELIQKLPYQLTKAQMKVWREISENMKSDTVMSRLVQGDVGSGKTIIAVLALLNAAMNGYQGAMMAPTEVLARQHYESICTLFETYDIPVKVVLLTGSMTAKEKRKVYDRIECGLAKIIIGTHVRSKAARNICK